MNAASRDFVTLTEILATGFDSPAQGTRLAVLCAELLDVHATTLVALDHEGAPGLAAASEETAELLTRFELAYDQGPAADALRTGERMECGDLAGAQVRWPRFTQVALDAGVSAACGLPCLLRDQVVGALALYMSEPGGLPPDNAELAGGLANAVALGVTAHRSSELAVLAGQLQRALDSRVAIEQAKGVLSERRQITVDEAFTILRNYARGTGSKLREVALDVVKGVLTLPEDD